MESVALRLDIAETAARRAGQYLKEQFVSGRALDLTYKGEINIVTACDLEAQRLIIDTILAGYPDDDVLAEEDSKDKRTADKPERWIVDPLDGTTNFVHGLPHFCISIAYEALGNIRLGVVYAPVLDEMYCALWAGGAFLNQAPINVSRTAALKDAVIASGFPYDMGDLRNNLREWAALARQIRSPRCVGAAALDLCYVACGRYDAYWELDLDPWDMAAGSLIVAEAGGLVTDAQGGRFDLRSRNILASNAILHVDILTIISAGR